jgi:hypothetical protein
VTNAGRINVASIRIPKSIATAFRRGALRAAALRCGNCTESTGCHARCCETLHRRRGIRSRVAALASRQHPKRGRPRSPRGNEARKPRDRVLQASRRRHTCDSRAVFVSEGDHRLRMRSPDPAKRGGGKGVTAGRKSCPIMGSEFVLSHDARRSYDRTHLRPRAFSDHLRHGSDADKGARLRERYVADVQHLPRD